MLDEVEDDLAEVFAFVDAPFVENCFAHGAEFFEGVLAEAVEELGAGDVVVCGFAAFEGFERVVESFADEGVGFCVVTSIFPNDRIDDAREVKLLHIQSVLHSVVSTHDELFDLNMSTVPIKSKHRRKTRRIC